MDWFAADGYWMGRLLFQRSLAVVYLVAFVCAANQFRVLIGQDGLTPVPAYLLRAYGRKAPTLFRLRYSDGLFAAVAWAGAAVSTALVLGLADLLPLWAGMLLWFVPWVLYLSIVNVGQVWYGFGWESLLCECGWYAVFLGNEDVPPPWLALIALRWLLFRLEFGAGMIKMRGDRVWRDLTALYYHHETQPMPGPFSWYFHHLPKPLHRAEVLANHVTQLVVPFLLFLPRPVSTIAAVVMIVTQLWLIASGNFSWLNWLAVVIALSVVPDSLWSRVGLSVGPTTSSPVWFEAVVIAFAVVVLVLSWWPARNLVARRQLMNASFNRLHLVNAYGAFGSITRVRREIVVEGSDNPFEDDAWREYEFKGKPGDPRYRPRQSAPYHLRLDWLMWFLALDRTTHLSWFVPFLRKLLAGDEATLKLLRHNPFPDAPPLAIRAVVYEYRYTTRAERRRTGAWWHRERRGELVPPMSL
ncbi:lipase maturation factor family protein [Luteipulveratus sp. YIM 133132]|uniref:lipase maturation factor family protein n=1 Tax=Luteipulveratus flavus TaxID=3031728 RepID=UPI0023B025B6|nr:lipase maturation factor family protein [Luteipulveratus sp. YIM 133132]MDE9364111.1 lipase maturation factor family protein [Luteipulveratus sp. YIM 133132]